MRLYEISRTADQIFRPPSYRISLPLSESRLIVCINEFFRKVVRNMRDDTQHTRHILADWAKITNIVHTPMQKHTIRGWLFAKPGWVLPTISILEQQTRSAMLGAAATLLVAPRELHSAIAHSIHIFIR